MRFQNNRSSSQDAASGYSTIPRPRADSRLPMLFSILKRLLFIAGAGMLGYAAFTILDGHIVQYYKTVQFDRTLQLPVNLRADAVHSGTPIGKLTIPSA